MNEQDVLSCCVEKLGTVFFAIYLTREDIPIMFPVSAHLLLLQAKVKGKDKTGAKLLTNIVFPISLCSLFANVPLLPGSSDVIQRNHMFLYFPFLFRKRAW